MLTWTFSVTYTDSTGRRDIAIGSLASRRGTYPQLDALIADIEKSCGRRITAHAIDLVRV